MYDCILFIGTGQIGKAILNEIVEKRPKKIIVHNLTMDESLSVCDEYSRKYEDIEFLPSYGNIFMPYYINDIDNRKLYEKSKEIIDYFYGNVTIESMQQSTIITLVKKYSPDLIIDAINTATVLGNSYNPESVMSKYQENEKALCEKLMVDDYTTKISNFVFCLRWCFENLSLKKYLKVSTTGLGGMGINMPYTHGDNPKLQLSNALVGKIAASGVLHQLLWNLSHEKNVDVSLLIPGTFVGYDSVLVEPIETDKGLLKKRENIKPYSIYGKNKLTYNNNVISKDYLQFPVVRAGENHVYSNMELEVLTAIGQMEAITKEEVARRAMECIYGGSMQDVIKSLDSAMLKPTYLGCEMIHHLKKCINSFDYTNGIATGNLGVTLSKQLYELYLIKKNFKTIDDINACDINDLVEIVNNSLSEELVEEIVTLGIPILMNNNDFYIGDYSLIPSGNEDNDINENNIEYWCSVGWVDLRSENIKCWCNILNGVYTDAKSKLKEKSLIVDIDIESIGEDYNIAEYLAYYYNMQGRGRKK